MNNKEIRLQFMGAAGTVTGSKTLVKTEQFNILIDCGLFQGLKHLRELNWEKIPFDAAEIDVVILTHGHLDHVGYLPRLLKNGFKGKVYGSNPTLDLAEIVLKDSAKIQEEDADHANKHGYTKHEPALPLYDRKDAAEVIKLMTGVKEHQWINLNDDIRFRMNMNSHILGATFIELDVFDKKIVFSGDIGRPFDPILGPPQRPSVADAIIVESTYGDRIHPHEDTSRILKDVIQRTLKRKGTLFIPSFTVDRAQDLLYYIWQMKKSNKIPDVPVYLDSPMGNDVSKLFVKYQDWRKIGPGVFKETFEHSKMVTSFKMTESVADDKNPKIVVAGSGMMNGGRILHYLKMNVHRKENTILICGYQAVGTRGRALQEGATELKIHGKYYPVRAEIAEIGTMSSHADQNELLDWLSQIKGKPDTMFINHGELHSAQALRVKIQHDHKWNIAVPKLYDEFVI